MSWYRYNNICFHHTVQLHVPCLNWTYILVYFKIVCTWHWSSLVRIIQYVCFYLAKFSDILSDATSKI